jgi:hypothetical protein
MDELINQLNKLDINKEIPDDSVDLLCDSISKIIINDDISIDNNEIIQVTNIISTLPLNPVQIKKLDCIGLLISKMMRKIKCYEFADAYAIPKYVF